MFTGVRSTTTRPTVGPQAPLSQITAMQAQRDSSLNAARQKYAPNPQSKRYSLSGD